MVAAGPAQPGDSSTSEALGVGVAGVGATMRAARTGNGVGAGEGPSGGRWAAHGGPAVPPLCQARAASAPAAGRAGSTAETGTDAKAHGRSRRATPAGGCDGLVKVTGDRFDVWGPDGDRPAAAPV